MSDILNSALLAGMVKEKRGGKGLREVCLEIGGISAATLSRIEQGKVPDVSTFIRICKWLGAPTDTFVVSAADSQPKSNREHIVAHLRAERELEPSAVQMLLQMINMAYAHK